MLEYLMSPVAGAVAMTLLHFLWQAAVVGAIYWGVLSATGIRTARDRYAASLFALGVLSICPLATFVVLFNDEPVAFATVQNPHIEGKQYHLNSDIPSKHSAAITGTIELSETVKNGSAATKSDNWRPFIQPVVLLLWLSGVILSGARLTAGFLNVFWLRFGRLELPADLKERSLKLAHRLELKRARIFASLRIREAAVVGFWRPVVLLPSAWLASLPPDVLEAVIAHELAHIRRFDVWVNLLQRFLETALFYHPVVWWLSNRVRLEREMCCDELAIQATGERGQYAIALEHIGRLQVRGTMQFAPTFTGERKMKLLSRIQHVLGTTSKPEQEPAWLIGLFAIAVPLYFFGMGGLPTDGNSAIAQEREGGRSAEAEKGPRRSAEAEAGPRRSPEAEAGPRRSAEGEAGNRRSAEGERGNPLAGFKPQSQREAALFQMILQLQREVGELRQAVQSQQGRRDGDFPRRDGEQAARPRDGEVSTLPVGWERSKAGGVFKSYDKNGDKVVSLDEWLAMTNGNISASRRKLQTERFLEAGAGSDKKLSAAEFVGWWNAKEGVGRRDGDGVKAGPRDGEGGARRGPRDGEGVKRGPRDGEGVKPGPRDGEGETKRGPRDRE